jgi:CRP/FNR family transcriptional regulator, cyclic AMP receptor protein
VLSLNQRQTPIPSVLARNVDSLAVATHPFRCRGLRGIPIAPACKPSDEPVPAVGAEPAQPLTDPAAFQQPHPEHIDAFYLFARHVEWEQTEDPSAGWELISAAHSADEDTRAHARALLSASQHLWGMGSSGAEVRSSRKRSVTTESDMNTPYDIEIIEDCAKCACTNAGFFCGFSHPLLAALNKVSQKSTLPAGAILFVEGQTPRGVFIICSGKVNLSTSSREGKTLILKMAAPGEALGLSAAISGLGYETTAETATPCQVDFVDRNHFLELLENHGEVGLHAAQSLSRDYHAAYRDIHDLVLTRSSTGKLARLLLTISEEEDAEDETSIPSLMTHEEMGHRIGASRETVTRLLGKLRKKHLIRLDGDNLVIRDRSGLEALTI